MNRKNSLSDWFYYDDDEFDLRCQRRLQEELGVNEEGIEVILRLRKQLLDLRAQMRRMEAEMAAHQFGLDSRLGAYHQEYFEAYWYELPGNDEGAEEE